MKKTALLVTVISPIFIIACNNKSADKPKELPKPGTVVASAGIPVTADTLNDFKFSVKVIADSSVKDGVYDVDVNYGPNFAESKFTMPKGGEQLIPVIRRGTKPYTFVIGFNIASDTTFYEYFEVSSTKFSTKMQYIKGYTF